MNSSISQVDEYHQMDISAPKRGVDITVREDGKVVWVNVDGICVLRICQIPVLDVLDAREPNYLENHK
jgi:hypothetical protein